MPGPFPERGAGVSGWCLNPDFPLCVRHWGGEFLVYHTGSGDTHLLDGGRYFVLALLTEQAQGTEQIAERLRAKLELEPHEAETGQVETLLSDLYGLALIEKVG